jgi:outer membrane protein OmpA-like peptidoglycan-associated protein
MKKIIALALVAAVVALSAPANAAHMSARQYLPDDMAWWGGPATPEPVKDPTRRGYWWWPTEAASNTDDSELWGNRGIVYHIWEPVAEVAETPQVPSNPPCVKRTVIVLNNVLFDFDKSTLKAEGKAEVDKLVGELNKYPTDSVVVSGHTCNIGTDEYNMGLGQRRADSVQSYIVQSGIAAGRATSVSKGETTPAVPNDTSANRALNRRAEFHITIGGDGCAE